MFRQPEMKIYDETAKRRLLFQTRRGLLELDILFKQFNANHFPTLNDEELSTLERLLQLPDQDLLAQVNQYQAASQDEFEPLLKKIRPSPENMVD